MRAALYVRVSSEEQKKHGISVDNQIQALTDYCNSSNICIAGVYNDAGISARKRYTKRPAMLQMLDDCRAGLFDIVLFTKLDRFFRNVADYYEVQRVLEEKGVPWKAIWEDYETATASGRLKVNIMLSVAQDEADRASERVKATQEYKRKLGQYPGGNVPIGFKREGKYLVHDPEKILGIKDFFAAYLSTYSLNAAIESAAANGLHINKPHACRLLRSTAYCGNAAGCKVEPIITEDQHNQILENMKKSCRQPKYGDAFYLFSGVLYCAECGGRMSGKRTIHHNRDGSICIVQYYRCTVSVARRGTCSGCYVNERQLEQYLLSNLKSELDGYNLSIEQLRQKPIEDVGKKIKALQGKLERIGDRYEDGSITKEVYTQKRDAIRAEINQLSAPHQEPKPIVLPDNWLDIYNALDNDHRRAFWRKTTPKIYITQDKSIPPKITFA